MKLFSLFLMLSMGAVAAFGQASSPEAPPPRDFSGPGVLSQDVGGVGSRGGRTADLRFYAGVNGVYDNGFTPFATDAQGNLLNVGALWGVEARLGLYGVHRWKNVDLGVDYTGSLRHYNQNGFYDGSDHALNLTVNYQYSRRVTLRFDESAGTYGRSLGSTSNSAVDSIGLTAPSQFWDTRTSYLRSGAQAVILQSARTFYTVGGTGYLSDHRAQGLADVKGYNVSGSVGRRLTQYQSVGVSYSFGQQDIPLFLTNATIHNFEGTYDIQIGPLWSVSARAGAYVSEITSSTSVTLDPILAALFGVPQLTLQTYVRNTFPGGALQVTRQFKQATLRANYSRGIGAGNGLVAVSRVESATAGISYSGLRKWSVGIDGGYYTYRDLTRSLGGSSTFSGGVGFNYNILRSLHANVRYDARHIDLDAGGNFRRDSSRVSFGLFFSPGEFPLSLW